jgi:hypothetical protein
MCTSDGPGVSLAYYCAVANEALFDCGHDDYFSTAPLPGSYLATHWNAADNVFLSADAPEACFSAFATTSDDNTTKRRRRGRRSKNRSTIGADVGAPCVPY